MRTFLCRNESWSPLRTIYLAAAVSGSMSCGSSDGEYSLLVRVEGAPADTRSLDVFFTLDGRPAPGSSVTQQLNYFGVKLPAGTAGKLEVNVAALGSDQCRAASGVTSIDLSAGRYQETTVTLAALNPRRCSLYYQSSGEGDLAITPPGTSCGVGCMDYPADTPVIASFNPTGKSFGAQVSLDAEASCDGLTPCSFTIKKRTQLTASFNPRLCLPTKWCWYNPLPQGTALNAFGGTGPNDIWAVGRAGSILHYDGTIWSLSQSGTSDDLNGVWASSKSEAWAVGDKGTVLHFNGSSWTAQDSGVLTSLRSLWGTSSSDIWAVGNGGVTVHYNGSAWTAVVNPALQNLYRVSGSSANNVWAVGPSGTVIRYTDAAWKSMPIPGQTTTNWNDVWVSPSGEVWTVGATPMGMCISARFDGTSWTSAGGCVGTASIWGSSPTDVWSAGSALMSLTRTVTPDVQAFKPQPLFQPSMYPGTAVPMINALRGFKPEEVYVGTDQGSLIKRNAETQTTILTAPPSFGAGLSALSGSGLPNDLFAVQQDGGVHRFDGRKLSMLSTTGGPTVAYDAWAAPVPSGDLFVASQAGQVYRYSVSTNSWSVRTESSTQPLLSIDGVSAAEVYVGTSNGFVHRYDGSAFTRLNPTAFGSSVKAIWMRTTGDGWAVGNGGLTVRIMGGTASTVTNTPAGTTNLFGLRGVPAPSQHLWVVGAAGYVARYDGSNWSKIPSGTTADLIGVAALSETDVWFAGTGGTLLHWNGTSISAVPSGITADLRKLWGNANTGLWLAGDNGVLLRHQP